MMKTFWITTILGAIMLSACDENGVSNSSNSTSEEETNYRYTLRHFEEKGFMVLHEGDGGNPPGGWTTKRTEVLNTQVDYETELVKYTSDTPVSIDFSANQILLIDRGQKSNTGGDFITVKSIEEGTDSVIVNIEFTVPTENCPLDDALSNPYQFTMIAKAKPLVLREEQVARCNNPG